VIAEDAGPDATPGTPDDVVTTDDLTYDRFQAYIGMRVFW
jgi:hypothetical protein